MLKPGWNFDQIGDASHGDAAAKFATMTDYRTTEPFTSAAGAMLAALPPSGVIVDIGPGNGEDADALTAAGYTVIGVDVRTDLVTPAGWELRKGSAANLPVADGSVDVVWANRVLHHLPNPADLFTSARRVLRPGGKLIVTWPDRSQFTCSNPAITPVMRRYLTTARENSANPASTRQVGEQMVFAGLSVTSTQFSRRRYHGPKAIGYPMPVGSDALLEHALSALGPRDGAALTAFMNYLAAGGGWVDLTLATMVATSP